MQFCSHELPVRRGAASRRCKLWKGLTRAFARALADQGGEDGGADRLHGHLHERQAVHQAAQGAPRAVVRSAARAAVPAHAARTRRFLRPFFRDAVLRSMHVHASRPPSSPPSTAPPPACVTAATADAARAQEGYVPGIGPASVAKLADKGVDSSVKLMGEFLMKGRSRADFCKLLTEAGGLKQRRAPRVRLLCCVERRASVGADRAFFARVFARVFGVCVQRFGQARDGRGDAGEVPAVLPLKRAAAVAAGARHALRARTARRHHGWMPHTHTRTRCAHTAGNPAVMYIQSTTHTSAACGLRQRLQRAAT
jgi:hypothetical protein